MYLASIYMQVYAISISDLSYMTDYSASEADIATTAISVFEEVGGLLHLPTPFALFARKTIDMGINISYKVVKRYTKMLLEKQRSIEFLYNKVSSDEIVDEVMREMRK